VEPSRRACTSRHLAFSAMASSTTLVGSTMV
jgi:hypothetical protein